MTYPSLIHENHWREWIESRVDPQIISLNVRSVEGRQACEHLLYNFNFKRVHRDAQWREVNRRYGHLDQGGWWCSGVDILNGGESRWGCLKPDKPKTEKRDGKQRSIKYEHPPNTSTEIFALRVSLHIWERISERYNVPIGEYTEFWRWVIDHPAIPLTVTEGAKKAGALLTAGYAAIALPGVWNGLRQPRDEQGNKVGLASLIPQLQQFACEGRQINFCFDADSKRQTKREVNNAICKTAKLFKTEKCEVRVVSWHPKLGKGVDDVLAAFGAETFHTLYESADSIEIWEVKQATCLTYDIHLELLNRYLGDFSPPSNCQLICLKSPKGTGKTEWLSKQVASILSSGERKILLLVHRIQLGESLCNRLGIDYISDIRENNSETNGCFGYGLCVDSFHPQSQAKFNPKDWEGAWLIIDEAEQVFQHLLNSATCQSDRVKILRSLQEVIQIILSTGGKIFLSDADLSDMAIDYVRALAGYDLKPWIAVNNWQPEEGWKIHNYEGSNPSKLITDLGKHIEQGGKPFVCLSGQKTKSQWGTQNIEAYLKKRFPDKAILRIDRESIADPNHPAYGCMANLNAVLPLYDIVLASPTIETGVSIDCIHFTSVWGIFQGIQTTDSVRQALARVRDSVPRYLWAKKTGIERIGNGATSIKSLLASQHKLMRANIIQLVQADFSDPIDTEFQTPSLTCWAKKAAAVNLGMAAYRATILKALEDEGHTIINSEGDEAAAEIVKTEVKKNKEAEYKKHCENVADAQSVDDKKYDDIKDKRARSESERLQYEKGNLERLYEIPIAADLVERHDKGWHPQIRLHYYLGIGRQHLPAREAKIMRGMLEAGEGAIFAPDANRLMLGAKIALLDWLGFDRLLEQREFSCQDEVILDIEQKTKAHRFEMRAGLGISISKKDSPMAIAQRLIGLIGYRFPYLRREGGKGNQVRIYGAVAANFVRDSEGKILLNKQGQATPIPDNRDEVFAAWLKRDTATPSTAAPATQSNGVSVGGRQNVSDDTVVRGSKDLITIGADYRGGVATEGLTTEGLTTEGLTTEGMATEGLTTEGMATEGLTTEGLTTEGLTTEGLATEGDGYGLVERLAAVATPEQFWQAVRGCSDEEIEDAIALQDCQPVRNQLRAWFTEAWLPGAEVPAAAVNSSLDAIASQPEKALEVGDRVKIKEVLLGGRASLARGLEGVVRAISTLGRLTVDCLESGIDYFDTSEVELMVSA